MLRKIFSIICGCFILFSSGASFAEDEHDYTYKDLNEQLVMAVLWMQTSGEYEALCYQAYNMLNMEIEASAFRGKRNERPYAIIVDCDETVLGNMEYEADLIGKDAVYSSETWDIWCRLMKSRAIPGAVECLKKAESKGIEVFYIGNRQKQSGLQYVQKNLKKCGFPYADEKHILSPSGTNDKQERLTKISEEYDVIAYVGDNLADFPVDAYKKTSKERCEIARKNHKKFGIKFILLPNPVYGGWEEGLGKNYYKLPAKEQNNIRKNELKKGIEK